MLQEIPIPGAGGYKNGKDCLVGARVNVGGENFQVGKYTASQDMV